MPAVFAGIGVGSHQRKVAKMQRNEIPLICATYMRASCDGSVEDQRRACDTIFQYTTVPSLTDPATEYVEETMEGSAALQRLVKDAEAGRFDVLIVDEGSRLSRDLQKLAKLMLWFAKLDIALIFVNERFCSDWSLFGQLFPEKGS